MPAFSKSSFEKIAFKSPTNTFFNKNWLFRPVIPSKIIRVELEKTVPKWPVYHSPRAKHASRSEGKMLLSD